MAQFAPSPIDGPDPTATHPSTAPRASVVPRSPAALRASRLAREVHAGQTDGYGDPVLEHVARVAARVPAGARPVALVHDVAARSPLSPEDVASRVGLDADERAAVALLVPAAGEDDLAHATRIAAATPGRARELAVTVKHAAVADHADRDPHCRTSTHARAVATLHPRLV